MLKKIFTILLLTLYILASFHVAFPLLEYALHYKYISTVLCENKSKPELNCCGKCYVKKKIAKAEETDNSTKPMFPKVRQLTELNSYIFTEILIDELVPKLYSITHITRITPKLLWGYTSLPSQPPEA